MSSNQTYRHHASHLSDGMKKGWSTVKEEAQHIIIDFLHTPQQSSEGNSPQQSSKGDSPQQSSEGDSPQLEYISVPMPSEEQDAAKYDVSRETADKEFWHSIHVQSASASRKVELRAGLDTCASLSAISYENAQMIGHQIRPCEDMNLMGVDATSVKPRGQIDCSFSFEGGMRSFHETFMVLDDPQAFDVILGEKFIRRNQLMVENKELFPLRKLTPEEKAALVNKTEENHPVRMAEMEERRKRAAEEREKERAKEEEPKR